MGAIHKKMICAVCFVVPWKRMWTKIQNTIYFLSFTENLEIFLTDYTKIWFSTFSTSSFLACLQESNIGLEIDEEELIKKGKQMLQNPDGLKNTRINGEHQTLVVSMTMSFGYPLKLVLKLEEGSKELFFQKITQELLRTVHDLRLSQQELRHLLQKKDKEIEEYKCEGGEIALRHLKTIPFNDEEHMIKHIVYNNHFGLCDVPEHLLELTDPDTKNTVKHEPEEFPMEIKTEPEVFLKKEDIKIEPLSNLQQSMASPKKRLKRMLNL